jgi:hypothetical protein
METALFSVWNRISPRVVEFGPDRITADERVFASIWMLKGEVDNGGFAQYMFNSLGEDAAVAREALAAVGASGALVVLEEFLALLPGGQAAATQDERQQQLDELSARHGSDKFNELLDVVDRSFYATEDELRDRLFEFVTSKGML